MKSGEITSKKVILPKFGDFGGIFAISALLGAQKSRSRKCYLGAARFSYVILAICGGGGGVVILPDAMRAPRGSPVKDAPRTPSGMYGAEIHANQ